MAEEQAKQEPKAEEKPKAYVLTEDALKAAIAAGDIKALQDKVTAEVGGKKHERPYRRLIAVTPKGCGILVGSSNAVVENFNYAYDLGRRAKERQALLAALEGPEKQLAKGVKTLMALGMTEAKAKATIVGNLEDEQYAALPDDWKALVADRFEAWQAAQKEQATTEAPATEGEAPAQQ